MAQGQARFGGYESDQAYRNAIAEEIDARTAASATTSKPLSASAFAQEAQGPTSDDLLLQASDKLTKALASHRGEMGVVDAFDGLRQMIEGATTVEAAALAVISFASQYPAYADSAVEEMDSTWGEWGREALAETVNEIAHAEAVQQSEQEQQEYDQHIEQRAKMLGGLSDEIARKDGEDVRAITAAMATQDETLAWGDDVQATSSLLGYREIARQGKEAVGKEAFLRELDSEIEKNGWAGRLHTDEDRRKFEWQAAETTREMTGIDVDQAFRHGRDDAARRMRHSVVGLPFDEAEFDAELHKNDRPAHAQTDAMNARDARDRAAHIERFGEPPPK